MNKCFCSFLHVQNSIRFKEFFNAERRRWVSDQIRFFSLSALERLNIMFNTRTFLVTMYIFTPCAESISMDGLLSRHRRLWTCFLCNVMYKTQSILNIQIYTLVFNKNEWMKQFAWFSCLFFCLIFFKKSLSRLLANKILKIPWRLSCCVH